jgi:hypothetical protein
MRKALFALVAVLGAGSAAADIRAFATITDFTATVVDLTPGDGFAAAVTLDPRVVGTNFWMARFLNRYEAGETYETREGETRSLFGPLSGAIAGVGSVSAAAGSGFLTAASVADGNGFIGDTFIQSGAQFDVTPFTRYTITGQVAVGGSCEYGVSPGVCSEAKAAAGVLLQGVVPDLGLIDAASVGFHVWYRDSAPIVPVSQPFSISFVNDSDQPARVSLSLHASALVTTQPTPSIPEPATAASVLLGLAGLAECMRRRRVASRPGHRVAARQKSQVGRQGA